MSTRPARPPADPPSEASRLRRDVTRLGEVLTRAAGASSAAEVRHALAFFLWPEVQRWDASTVPDSLRRLIAEEALAAGVTAETAPDEAKKRVEAFFARFPPDRALLEELEALATDSLADHRHRMSAAAEKVVGGPVRASSPSAAYPIFRSSTLLRAGVQDEDALNLPSR